MGDRSTPGAGASGAEGGGDRAIEIAASTLGPGEMRAVEHAGVAILVVNVDGDYFAVENVCSHAAVPLDEGELRGHALECRFHGAVFDVRTGAALARPALRPIRRFEVTRQGDRILIHV